MLAPPTSRRSSSTCARASGRSSCPGSRRPIRISFLATRRCTRGRTDRTPIGRRSARASPGSSARSAGSGRRRPRRTSASGGRPSRRRETPPGAVTPERSSRWSDVAPPADVGRFREMAMTDEMDRLLDLQERDSALARLRSRREEIESGEEIRRLRGSVEDVERTLGELRLANDAVTAEQRRLENEIDSVSRKTDAEQKRLYDGTIVNVKELDALQAEIKNLGERRGRLEDDVIDRMERREELETRIVTAEADVTSARDTLERESAGSATELERISKDTGNLQEQRDGLAAGIDGELLELYEDLRSQKRGVGVAALIDGVCQGCHQKLSAMELDRLKKTSGIKRCEYCRRILVAR